MILRFRRSAEDDCGMAFPTNTTPLKTLSPGHDCGREKGR